MASKLFGGANLGDIARAAKDRPSAAAPEAGVVGAARSVMPTAELAITGRMAPPLERENIFAVDPKRVKPWAHHNRTAAWYTRERCLDLIESIAKDGQQEPAVARKLTGDPKFDFELISGMRRRFACEFLTTKLKLRIVDADDVRAAVLMHIENADRQDITAMERALSFQEHLDARIFATQEALSEAIGLSKGQVAKMVKAASLLRQASLAALFVDKGAVPVEPAYKLAALMDRPGAKEVVLQAAQNLGRKGEAREPGAVLKALLASLDNSKKFEAVQKTFNVGAAGRLVVTRNARGKVTMAFPRGLKGLEKVEVLAAVEKVLADLG
jgi:ParB family chromosome partitioning protein